jgi:thiamine-phosphate pyrophosphorylase
MTALPRPITCLVTDRSRLPEPRERALVRLIRAAAAAGVTIIQLRERDMDDRTLLSLTAAAIEAVQGTDALVLVNERTDVAIAAGAAGVHLRGDSPDAARVRAICPQHFVVGRSVHAIREAVAAEESGVDYILMGTVFETASKGRHAPVAGPGALAEVCRAVRTPVLAIGGISPDNLSVVARAGAAGMAGIGFFADAYSDRDDALGAAMKARVEMASRWNQASEPR